MNKGMIMGVIILVIFLGVVGIYSLMNSENLEPSQNAQIQNGDSTQWRTYSNSIYEFEVQYPPYGFITADNYRFASDIDDYTIEIRIPRNPSPPNAQAFFIEVIGVKSSLEDFSSSTVNIAKQNGGSVFDMVVAGVPAKKIMQVSSDGTEISNVLFVKNEHGYYITMIGPGFEDAEKMLTTFKFNN